MARKPVIPLLIGHLSLAAAVVVAALPPMSMAEARAEQALPPVDVVTPKAKKAAKPAGSKSDAEDDPAASAGTGGKGSGQAIAVLVNDEPITGHEIEQRMRISGGSDMQEKIQAQLKAPNINDRFKAFAIARLKANPPKSKEEQQERIKAIQKQFVDQIKQQVMSQNKPEARKAAVDDLIDERLKMQEAKKLSVVAADEEIDRYVKALAERNKMSEADFAAQMKKMGVDIRSMRERHKTALSWRDVIRRKFGHVVAIADRDVDRLVSTAPGGDVSDEVELQVQRISYPIAGKLEQQAIASKLEAAEALRSRLAGCKSASEMVKTSPGAKFEALGPRKAGAIPEPTRTLLLNAATDDTLPPTVGDGGIELWMLCGRQTVKADDQKRQAAQEELKQREFELLAKRHLKDLRQDAHIEYR